MRRRFAGVSVGLVGLMTMALYHAPTAGAASISCTGSIGAVTVDDVLVPNGATCTLTRTNVRGKVTVLAGAVFNALGGTRIAGAVTSGGAAGFKIDHTTIGGAVTIDKTTGGEGEAVSTICSSTIKGRLTLTNGALAAKVMIGDLPPDDLCSGADTIGGGVTMSQNQGNTQLSDNKITGTVTFNNNVKGVGEEVEVEYDLGENSINGDLVCKGNNPVPFSSTSTVTGKRVGQC